MVVEIKQTDTPEEVKKKLLAIREETEKQSIERKERIMKHFGSIKSDIDAVEFQRQIRSEWDDRENELKKIWEASRSI